jgi:hypothetical protein
MVQEQKRNSYHININKENLYVHALLILNPYNTLHYVLQMKIVTYDTDEDR